MSRVVGSADRNIVFDYAKGIGIFLMCLVHVCGDYDWNGLINAFHMPFFFLVGGIFFKVQSTIKNTIEKSVRQLLIPYLLFSIIGLSIGWISPYLHPELYPGLDSIYSILQAAFLGIFLAPNYFTGNAFLPVGPLWFLLALFWCRIAAKLWFMNPVKKWLKVVSWAMILLTLWYLYIKRIPYLSLDCTSVSFPFFLIGVYSRDVVLKLCQLKQMYRIVIGSITVLALYIISSNVNCGGGIVNGAYYMGFLRGISGSIMLIILCSLLAELKGEINWLSLLGKSTLTVLALHFHILYIAKVAYKLILHGNPGETDMIYGLIVAVMMCYCLPQLHLLFEKKYPWLIGKKVIYPKSQSVISLD